MCCACGGGWHGDAETMPTISPSLPPTHKPTDLPTRRVTNAVQNLLKFQRLLKDCLTIAIRGFDFTTTMRPLAYSVAFIDPYDFDTNAGTVDLAHSTNPNACT